MKAKRVAAALGATTLCTEAMPRSASSNNSREVAASDLSELRDRLCAGDVWVRGSRRHRNFENLLGAPREAEVVDGLVELLIQLTHRITVKAERRVVDELVEEAREVRGEAGILFRVGP